MFPILQIHSISFVLRIPAILSRESFVSFVPEEPIAMQFHAQNWDQFYIDFVASKSPLWTAGMYGVASWRVCFNE